MINTIEKDERITKPEIKLGRLVFCNYLEELLFDITSNEPATKNLNFLLNTLQSAQHYSQGELISKEYLNPKDSFNFVIKSLDSTELLNNGFNPTINNIFIAIENYKDNALTQENKIKLIMFLEKLIANISYKNNHIEERTRFDW